MIHGRRHDQQSAEPRKCAAATPSPRQLEERFLRRDLDMSGTNLVAARFDGLALAGARFRNACLRGVNFTGANLVGADFTEADLRGGYAQLTAPAPQSVRTRAGSAPVRASFVKADLCGADLSRALLSGADLSHASMRGVIARETDFSGADLSGSDLTDADLTGARLCGANLDVARLTNCRMAGADLRDVRLYAANLSALRFVCPSMEGPRHGLRGLLESHRHWIESHGFDGDRLVLPDLCAESFDLSRRNLSLADLRAALFEGCNMRGIALRQADLHSARFLQCDLTGASFRGAKLTDAQFIGCTVAGADFRQYRELAFDPTLDTIQWPTRLSGKTKFVHTNLEHARFDIA